MILRLSGLWFNGSHTFRRGLVDWIKTEFQVLKMRLGIALAFGLVAVSCVQARPKHQKHHKSPFDLIDPCLAFECPRHRQCYVNTSTGLAECMCQPSCPAHVKPVCGSDGVLYENHCELHRTACLGGHHISIIHGTDCSLVTTPPPVPPITPVAYTTIAKKPVVATESIPTVVAELRTEANTVLAYDEVEVPTDDDVITPNCSKADFLQFKAELLSHYRKQFRTREDQPDPSLPPMTEKFLLSFLFDHLDTDQDNVLSVDELRDALTLDGLQAVSYMCTMEDFLRFDRDSDGRLVAPELYDVFGIQPVSISEDFQRKTLSAEAGTNLVLVCDIETRYNLKVAWQRGNTLITEESGFDGINKYHGDDRLYLVKVKLLHTGEYECYAAAYPEVRQVLQVTVQVSPTVSMCPHNQLKPRGSTTKVQCRAQGVPSPKKSWTQNQNPLDVGEKYELDDSNSSLIVHHIDYADTGVFDCLATNDAGMDTASASIFIKDSSSPDFNTNNVYYFFHKSGIQIVEPETCAFQDSLHADSRLSENEGPLCHKNQSNGQRECHWGAVVNVKNRYIYASQPTLKRVLVVDLRLKEVVEIIKFDKMPVALTYTPDLDTVWVESWQGQQRVHGLHGVKVIRDASEPPPHVSVHLRPTGKHYDVIESLHLPSEQIYGQGEMHYGYTTPRGKQALLKIDLVSLTHAGRVDLSDFDCHPNSVAFVAIGGQVIVNCEASGDNPERQLFVDYVTDEIIGVNEGVQGQVYVTPDGRYVVSVDRAEQHIQVQKVSDEGAVETDFQVSTNLHISDLGFYPIMTSHAYDVIATSRNREEAIYISLESGKVEMIPGMHPPIREGDWVWDSHNRKIAPSGLFGPYMVSPSADRVIILNGQYRRLHCDVDHLVNANVFAWVGIC